MIPCVQRAFSLLSLLFFVFLKVLFLQCVYSRRLSNFIVKDNATCVAMTKEAKEKGVLFVSPCVANVWDHPHVTSQTLQSLPKQFKHVQAVARHAGKVREAEPSSFRITSMA